MGNIFSDPSSNITDAEVAAIGLISGIITGMVVSINADPTKFDVSAGTGVIIDWSTGSAVITEIVFPGATAVAITAGIGNSTFTGLYVDSALAIQQIAGGIPTPSQTRQNVVIDTLVHADLTTITVLSVNSIQAYQGINAVIDYVKALGAINTGNRIVANSNDLTIKKEAGTTALPWLNRNVDDQNPTVVTNAAQSPVSPFLRSYQDGVGGFTLVTGATAVDTGFFDDGSGTLAAVNNAKYYIKRCIWFPQTETFILTYGQAAYNNLADAENSILSEAPDIDPIFAAGSFVTALVHKGGATDLSDTAEVSFINILNQSTSATPAIGSVTKVGTPVNNQVGVWTGDGTLEGDADLTFDGTDLTVTGEINAASSRLNSVSLQLNESGTGDRQCRVRFYTAGTAQSHNAELARAASVNATLNLLNSGTSQIQVQQGGTGGVALLDGATAWASISDVKKKKNIVPFTNAIEKLLVLDPCFFDYRNDSYPKKRVGLTAQEVQKVLPEAVHTVEERDSEGKVTGETSLVVTYTDLIPLLISGIQELTARVEDLEGA